MCEISTACVENLSAPPKCGKGSVFHTSNLFHDYDSDGLGHTLSESPSLGIMHSFSSNLPRIVSNTLLKSVKN